MIRAHKANIPIHMRLATHQDPPEYQYIMSTHLPCGPVQRQPLH